MDRGFAGIVAVALLGCAVVLAIAFQISEGLEMEAAGYGGGQEAPHDKRESPELAGRPSGIPETGGRQTDMAGSGGLGEICGPAHDSTETPACAISGLGHDEGPASAALESGDMTGGQKGTPIPTKEINPAEGHTVSPRAADEIEERAPNNPFREHGETRIPNVTSNDPTSPGTSALEAPNGAASAETAPAIEMIRGTRRSTEPIAAPENQD